MRFATPRLDFALAKSPLLLDWQGRRATSGCQSVAGQLN